MPRAHGPVGFGLENYDAIGRWRDEDGGQPDRRPGVLPGGERFETPAQLKAILRESKDTFTAALSEKMLTYAMGARHGAARSAGGSPCGGSHEAKRLPPARACWP
ncbi:MAG: DUF1585 domain-containing protein [Bryobacterales bacterium]